MLPHSAPRLLAHLPVGQQDPAVVIPRVSTVESVQRVATSGFCWYTEQAVLMLLASVWQVG